jgi:hypothetical protein
MTFLATSALPLALAALHPKGWHNNISHQAAVRQPDGSSWAYHALVEMDFVALSAQSSA